MEQVSRTHLHFTQETCMRQTKSVPDLRDRPAAVDRSQVSGVDLRRRFLARVSFALEISCDAHQLGNRVSCRGFRDHVTPSAVIQGRSRSFVTCSFYLDSDVSVRS